MREKVLVFGHSFSRDEGFQGACNCPWRGPWRETWEESDRDLRGHLDAFHPSPIDGEEEEDVLKLAVRTRFVRVYWPGPLHAAVAQFDYYGFGMRADEWRRMGRPQEVRLTIEPWESLTDEEEK